MKYQSELIKEIVDSRGHDKSSIHYESECVETWIEEVKGAYPKLCDYESEWLNYISILDDTGGSEKPEPPVEPEEPEPPVEPEEPEPEPPVEPEEPEPEPPIGKFPYVALTDVTEVTVNNVVPYAYKSAILKGKTDENLQSVKMPVLRTSNKPDALTLVFNQKPFNKWDWTALSFVETFNGRIKVKLKDSASSTLRLNIMTTEENTVKENTFRNGELKNGIDVYFTEVIHIGFFSREDGIAYGNGIDIVKEMINNGDIEFKLYEDGFKSIILTVNEDVTLRSNGGVYDKLNLLTGKLTQRIDEDGSVLTQEVIKTVKLSITNQDGETLTRITPIEGTMHLSTSSDTIPPLFSGEIPVEAITQNLASFIEEE